MRRQSIAQAVMGWLAGALAADPGFAEEIATAPVVEHYTITSRYSTVSEGGDSTSSSSGGGAYREEVRNESDTCQTRTFDIDDPSGRKRPLVEWQMPVVLRECAGAARQLANREVMLARRDAFLAAIMVTTEACGKYYFTWNVFQIECDPDEAVERLANIDLGGIRLEDGADYILPDTGTRVTLTLMADALPDQRVYTGRSAIDPAYLREKAVETIMVVAEVSGETVSREDAMAKVADRQFSGESAVTLVEEPAAGRITSTITGETREVRPDGIVETRRGEVVTIRQRVEAASGSDPS